MGSGFCVSGCIYGAKQSLHVNYLPQAVAAGARIECDLEALGIRTLVDVPATAPLRSVGALRYRYEVRCRRRSDARELVAFQAKIVILGGGTIGTAALLLRSRADLPRLSSEVGKHIAFNGSVKVAALLPEHFPVGDMFAGRSHPGMISYQFLESHGISVSAGKAMPLMVVSAARLRLDGDGREPAWWGQANVDLMRQMRHRMIALVSFGLTPPGGTITLGADGQPALSLSPTSELQRYAETTHGILQDILVRNGCRMIDTEWVNKSGVPADAGLHFATAHQVGSCRMADDRRHGVVNAAGEVFGYPGLYVSDGAAIPSSLAVNTSLTILANAERIADGIRERLGLP